MSCLYIAIKRFLFILIFCTTATVLIYISGYEIVIRSSNPLAAEQMRIHGTADKVSLSMSTYFAYFFSLYPTIGNMALFYDFM